MNTDREMLEWAAKAAKIDCQWVPTGPDAPTMVLNEPYYAVWNPIERAGDRYGLAKKLNLSILFKHQTVSGVDCRGRHIVKSWGDDPKRKDCKTDAEAVLAVAAEIGRAMP